MSTDIEEITTALAEFDAVEAGLAELRQQYAGVVYDVTATAGMEQAKAARAAIRQPRYRVEAVRKQAKAPILALGKRIDADAKRITAAILEIEEPIDRQINTEEQRKEAETQAAIDAELRRVEKIKERIAELRGCQMLTPASGTDLLAGHIGDLDAIPVDDSFDEFREEAERTKAAGLERLRGLHQAAAEHEEQLARAKAEREELERLRAEQAERDRIERERLAKERAEQEARDRAEREKIAKERAEAEAAARAEAEKLAAERRAIEEERHRQEVERARIEAQQVEQERQRKLAEEAEERRRAEVEARARREADRPSDTELAAVIATHYSISEGAAVRWLSSFGRREAA